jgi:hypothetical protein
LIIADRDPPIPHPVEFERRDRHCQASVTVTGGRHNLVHNLIAGDHDCQALGDPVSG